MQYVAFDSHKRYTLASVEEVSVKGIIAEARINHEKGAIKEFLGGFDKGSSVAVETIGNWYWIVDEIEEAGMIAKLVHARRAKLMMANGNKTDKLDARGMNRLQRNDVLPSVWIPPQELRDKRDLPRTRMMFAEHRARLKNRIHSVLAKYALSMEDYSDAFGVKARLALREKLNELPVHTRYSTELILNQLETLESQIKDIETHMKESFLENEELKLLMSIPGVGFILGTVIWLEVGDIDRFGGAPQLASYSGTVPRMNASGDKYRMGGLRSDVNRYLKWAYVEAAHSIALHAKTHPERHATQLFKRIQQRKGYHKAIGAVARHLAEATYWILKKKEPYKDRALTEISSVSVALTER